MLQAQITTPSDKLKKVSAAFGQPGLAYVTRQVLGAVAVAAERYAVPEYPAQSHKPLPLYYTLDGRKSKFKSARQRDKVMALVHEGRIPYRRTGTLGKSITSKVEHAPGATEGYVSIGTNLIYAPYVLRATKQSFYHKGTWTPLGDQVAAALPQINQAATAMANKAIDHLLSQ